MTFLVFYFKQKPAYDMRISDWSSDVCSSDLSIAGTLMLSYRHAFHAGNHADVLKHAVTIQLLQYLGQKDAPYMVIDTHAGAGVYALDSGEELGRESCRERVGTLV